jgi:hypothetical protein
MELARCEVLKCGAFVLREGDEASTMTLLQVVCHLSGQLKN